MNDLKLCAVSDLHGRLDFDIPPCDLLVIAGDLCPNFRARDRRHEPLLQSLWLRAEFVPWLMRQPVDQAVGTFGNHDWFEDAKEPVELDGAAIKILVDEAWEYRGVRFYGSPWQREFCNWAFNLPEDKLAEKYAQIPAGIDVLISHGPPYGYGDTVSRGRECLGSPSLTLCIQEKQIPLTICGHIHGGHGQYRTEDGHQVVNASLLDESYRLVNAPTLIEFEVSR